jgi:hypothetical protein
MSGSNVSGSPLWIGSINNLNAFTNNPNYKKTIFCEIDATTTGKAVRFKG